MVRNRKKKKRKKGYKCLWDKNSEEKNQVISVQFLYYFKDWTNNLLYFLVVTLHSRILTLTVTLTLTLPSYALR